MKTETIIPRNGWIVLTPQDIAERQQRQERIREKVRLICLQDDIDCRHWVVSGRDHFRFMWE